MASCSLNLAHPKFQALISKHVAKYPGFTAALDNLAAEVLKDIRLCTWIQHPMPGVPEFQNRVWKWDFEPDKGSHSSTRKGWRLFALARGPVIGDHPMPADAFFCYDKGSEPGGNPASWLVKELKKFLREDTPVETEASFRRFVSGREIRSLCMSCCETVFFSEVEAEISFAESAHVCPPVTVN